MTSIYYDPTESKDNTRLDATVVSAGSPLVGLERLTGADLLITPLSEPKLEYPKVSQKEFGDIFYCARNWGNSSEFMSPADTAKQLSLPLPKVIQVIKFLDNLRTHIDAGCLVQRKTGRDLASSVPNLSSILIRMQEWTDRPWLVFIGHIHEDAKTGNAVIDGQASGFGYHAVLGAIDAWQRRGGYYMPLTKDRDFIWWINNTLNRLRSKESDVMLNVRTAQQKLLAAEKWHNLLAMFPGVGAVGAQAIAQQFGSFAESVCFLSDPLSIQAYGNKIVRESVLKNLQAGLFKDYQLIAIKKDEESRNGE